MTSGQENVLTQRREGAKNAKIRCGRYLLFVPNTRHPDSRFLNPEF